MRFRQAVCVGLVGVALAALVVSPAGAAVAPAGVQAGAAVQAAVPTQAAARKGGEAPCNVAIPVIGGVISTITNAGCHVGGAIVSGIGSVVSGVGNTILDAIAGWLIGAATAITKFVAAQMTSTTTPALESSWFAGQFAPIAALGAALALLVTLIALASAAVRRSPEALASTLVAVVRAGFGTGVIVALTVIGLRIADAISTDVLTSSPDAFWNTVATAWGHQGFGGFGSSALAALIALVEVFGALLVWLELIVRDAVIYIAVLFFPVALAASIWPPLAGWTGRLGRLLLLFVMLKPVTLIVLSLAGNAAASGLSLAAGASQSVGTILAAVVIFALAAFAPWALMYLLSADAESAWTAGALRGGTSGAVAGTQGRSLRNGGGLANLRSGATGGGGGGSGGGAGDGLSPAAGGGGGGTSPSSGSDGGGVNGGSSAGANGGAAAAAGVIGGGSVAAAAGMHSGPASPTNTASTGEGDKGNGSRSTPAQGGGQAGGADPGGGGGHRGNGRGVTGSAGGAHSDNATAGSSAKPGAAAPGPAGGRAGSAASAERARPSEAGTQPSGERSPAPGERSGRSPAAASRSPRQPKRAPVPPGEGRR